MCREQSLRRWTREFWRQQAGKLCDAIRDVCPAGAKGRTFNHRIRRWASDGATIRTGHRPAVLAVRVRRHRHHCHRAGGNEQLQEHQYDGPELATDGLHAPNHSTQPVARAATLQPRLTARQQAAALAHPRVTTPGARDISRRALQWVAAPASDSSPPCVENDTRTTPWQTQRSAVAGGLHPATHN